MTAPDKIWAWRFSPEKQDDVIKGGWTDIPDLREIEYTRTAAHPVTVQMLKLWADECGRTAGMDLHDNYVIRNIEDEIRAAIAQMEKLNDHRTDTR